jgi:hypothetical protein
MIGVAGMVHAGRLLGTNPKVFCCRLLGQVSGGAQFSRLERLPVTQEVAGSSPVAPASFFCYLCLGSLMFGDFGKSSL